MMEIVKVIRIEPVGGYRLRVRFSNALEGERDFSDMIAEGGAMVTPLVDPAFFARVFVQMGVPTWPNGFDIDAIALFQDMTDAGQLESARQEAI